MKIEKRKAFWLWVAIGLASVIWVLIRVIPKPSRADYPCQKVARPIAVGFIAWFLGLAGSTLFIRRARTLFQKQKFVLGAVCFAFGALLCLVSLNDTREGIASVRTTNFVPTDPANSPVGVAKGIYPGRVVWVYDSELCNNKVTNWWEDTDPEVAKRMVTQAIYNLTGIADPVKAWDALFKNFNQTRYGQNDTGYQAGDKIAIKLNNIFSRSYKWSGNQLRSNPQMVHALIWHLVNNAGVPEEDITFYDCIFYHGDPVYNYNHAAFPGVRWAEGDATDRSGYEGGPGNNPGTREKVEPDPDCTIHYGNSDLIKGFGKACLPTIVSEAKYIMSFSLPRPHPDLGGVTCCAKNFFGSIWHETLVHSKDDYYHHWCPMFMHAGVAAHTLGNIPMLPMGSYNVLVDIMGHEDLGGKALLLIGECIHQDYWSAPPFNGKYASSLFVSQDFVAIESVLIDFLRSSDYGLKDGTIDNYLHEAAQADNPASGTVYDPEGDGTRLKSLGVHEHWNNATDKQYSRNLGTGEGIELIQVLDNPEIPSAVTHLADNSDYSGSLLENYPNPFHASTTIKYTVPEPADVCITLFNGNGEKVCTLVNRHHAAGCFETSWDGNRTDNIRETPGIYICRMDINTGRETISRSRKMVVYK